MSDQASESSTAASDFLDELTDYATLILARDYGLQQQAADQAARQISETMRSTWGGLQVYFQKGIGTKSAARDSQLMAEFNGKNVRVLCQKFGISTPHFYSIRRRHLAKSSAD